MNTSELEYEYYSLQEEDQRAFNDIWDHIVQLEQELILLKLEPSCSNYSDKQINKEKLRELIILKDELYDNRDFVNDLLVTTTEINNFKKRVTIVNNLITDILLMFI